MANKMMRIKRYNGEYIAVPLDMVSLKKVPQVLLKMTNHNVEIFATSYICTDSLIYFSMGCKRRWYSVETGFKMFCFNWRFGGTIDEFMKRARKETIENWLDRIVQKIEERSHKDIILQFENNKNRCYYVTWSQHEDGLSWRGERPEVLPEDYISL